MMGRWRFISRRWKSAQLMDRVFLGTCSQKEYLEKVMRTVSGILVSPES
jgi:hypothetical protein